MYNIFKSFVSCTVVFCLINEDLIIYSLLLWKKNKYFIPFMRLVIKKTENMNRSFDDENTGCINAQLARMIK